MTESEHMTPRVVSEELTPDEIRELTEVIRRVDERFEVEGGGTRLWVRDYLLPELEAAGWVIHKVA